MDWKEYYEKRISDQARALSQMERSLGRAKRRNKSYQELCHRTRCLLWHAQAENQELYENTLLLEKQYNELQERYDALRLLVDLKDKSEESHD